ncbi:AtpZ/AtpI family protein [Candidatus Tisiphia endosymbiont of Ptychoptera albimana]|uniref:AtpZ/AtpI family protein n=1 Tax=Candidatus Tisiphia endosymbiont of Ptychoptera albimana TaxID=3066260 RepID=UPI0039779028
MSKKELRNLKQIILDVLRLNPEKQIDAFAIALDLVSSVMLGLIVGFTLDKLFHSKPFCVIIFLLIGMLAGFRIIWQKLNIKK